MSISSHLRIVKVGGSLFELDNLGDMLRKWLARQPPAVTALLAGGGPLVDCIRQSEERLNLGDEATHWLSIDAMERTARILARLLPEASFVDDFTLLKRGLSKPTSPIVFAASTFLRENEPHLPGAILPHDWSVTSDSIAARLAETLQADELTLLKSSNPKSGHSAADWADEGLVDQQFPLAAENLPLVRCVNLRSEKQDGYPLNSSPDR